MKLFKIIGSIVLLGGIILLVAFLASKKNDGVSEQLPAALSSATTASSPAGTNLRGIPSADVFYKCADDATMIIYQGQTASIDGSLLGVNYIDANSVIFDVGGVLTADLVEGQEVQLGTGITVVIAEIGQSAQGPYVIVDCVDHRHLVNFYTVYDEFHPAFSTGVVSMAPVTLYAEEGNGEGIMKIEEFSWGRGWVNGVWTDSGDTSVPLVNSKRKYFNVKVHCDEGDVAMGGGYTMGASLEEGSEFHVIQAGPLNGPSNFGTYSVSVTEPYEDVNGNIIYDEAVAGIAVWATCAKEESAEYVATPHFL